MMYRVLLVDNLITRNLPCRCLILQVIFPDSVDEEGTQDTGRSLPTRREDDSALTWRLKSAPVDSLTHFMATVLCNVNDMHGRCGVERLLHFALISMACICRKQSYHGLLYTLLLLLDRFEFRYVYRLQ